MRIFAAIGIVLARVLYAGLKLVFPRRAKVVFLSRQSDTPSRDFRMLAEELASVRPDVEIVVRSRFLRGEGRGALTYAGELLAQMRHLADASVCVVDGYAIPVSILKHRRELRVIQTWHALGAIKKFGWQAVGTPGGRNPKIARAMRMHANYDVVLCGGPGSIGAFAEAFAVEVDKVRPLGLPRVDFLLAHADDSIEESGSAQLRRLAERNPRLSEPGRTVVLYAPTFRSGRSTDLGPVIEAFAGEEWTLVVKPHDFEQTSLLAEHVVSAAGIDMARLLPLCDVLITDYSAVAFEALVLDKPVYFYVYDIDDYRETHGLNIDPLVELPESSSREITEIARRIAQDRYDTDAAHAFAEGYVPQFAGCTRRITELVVAELGQEPAT